MQATRTCSVEGCDRPHYGKGYCSPHYQRWIRHGDVTIVQKPRWRGESIGYDGMHQRLRRYRGNAAIHWCESCDQRAVDWAYDHDDPNERIDSGNGYLYSIDPEHYRPMCRSCHTSFDISRGGATRWSASLRSGQV